MQQVLAGRAYRLLLFLLISVCVQTGAVFGQEAPPLPVESDYFPLDVGMSWNYQGTDFNGRRFSAGATVVGTSRIDVLPVFHVQYTTGWTDFYTKTPSQVLLFAYQPRGASGWTYYHPPTVWLPLPVQTGKRWTKFWAIEGWFYRGNFEIRTVTERVSTPAGTFESCALIEGAATYTSVANPATVFQSPIRQWFCPGIGEVKFTQTLSSGGTTMTFEYVLVSFSRGR